jgi:hypothetical protein
VFANENLVTFHPTPEIVYYFPDILGYPNGEYNLQIPLKTPGLPIRAFLKNPSKCPDLI